MGFFSLLEVAAVPIIEVLLISVLGALLATDYFNLLHAEARKSLNKIVFVVFTPSLMFASLAKTVTLDDIVSWWFMPINIGMTFLVGGVLGWIAMKLLKPEPYLEGVVIAICSSGNLGNLMLIIIPAICRESGSPFGDKDICSSVGLSYASFSMALGGFFIWTYTYNLIRISSVKFQALKVSEENEEVTKSAYLDYDADGKMPLLEGKDEEVGNDEPPKTLDNVEDHLIVSKESKKDTTCWSKLKEVLHTIIEELMAPPTIAAILGFIVGAVTWLRNLFIGDSGPLRVIQDSIKLLGDGTIPCITLILGGNLTSGLKTSKIKPLVTIAVICVRYVIQPAIGIVIVQTAGNLGFLPPHKLFRYVLMIQYTVPPAMNIGTMTQLFDVGQEECSVLFLWTYLVAAIALTVWSTIFMWILA